MLRTPTTAPTQPDLVPTRKRGKGGWSTSQRPAEERFWEKVNAQGDCWEWTGGRKPTGYGTFSIYHGRAVNAHRYAWETLLGPIPDGLTIDHQCRNRLCVNPAHLRVVTQRENNRASYSPTAIASRRTCCPRGHSYSTANTRIAKDGARRCLTCTRERSRAFRANSKAARVIARGAAAKAEIFG